MTEFSRVLIAGAGVAGLEALMAIRSLAGERVELALLAPDDEFVYRPIAVQEPYAVGRTRRIALREAADAARAAFFATTIDAVDPDEKVVTTSDGRELEYDSLLVAVGAEPAPAAEHVLTWDDRADAELLGGLLQDIEQGYARRVAVVVPPGPGWPLRGYELALVIALDAKGANAAVETTIVTPQPAPLEQINRRAAALVAEELERAGVTIVSAAEAEVVAGDPVGVVLQPSGRRIEVDRALALPVLRGRRLDGIPADEHGFIEVDEHCRVRGVDAVWAAGDATSFPLKSGGFAAEQAGIAAEDIAASAGAPISARPFIPGRRDELLGLPAGRYLQGWLGANDASVTTHLPDAGVPVLTYLQRDLAAGRRG